MLKARPEFEYYNCLNTIVIVRCVVRVRLVKLEKFNTVYGKNFTEIFGRAQKKL